MRIDNELLHCHCQLEQYVSMRGIGSDLASVAVQFIGTYAAFAYDCSDKTS
jgi:hypothetical protein